MALAYSNVKSLKPIRGLREAIIDITLDGSYANGGWSITAANLTNYSGIGNVIYDVQPSANRAGYSFEWDQVNGKLKVTESNASDSYVEAALAEFVQYPADTETEQAAGYAKVYDSTAEGYLALSATAAGDNYTADYQLFPDTPVALLDYCLFGGAVPFAQLHFTVGTGAVYNAASVVGWNYWNGTIWADLDAVIINDNSGSTGQTGDYAFEQTGDLIFVPPQDWAASTIDSQLGYWIQASVETGKVANMTTVPILSSEHDLNVVTTGYVPTRDGVISSVCIHDAAATLHTAADIKFIVLNTTTGRSSGVCTFAQDIRAQEIALSYPVPVSIGDKCAIIVTQEDGTNEAGPVNLVFNYSGAEALANDANLNGVVLRCRVLGS